jgi:hypothetical protein
MHVLSLLRVGRQRRHRRQAPHPAHRELRIADLVDVVQSSFGVATETRPHMFGCWRLAAPSAGSSLAGNACELWM